MAHETLVHETTYRKRNPIGWVHRNRLQAIGDAFARHVDTATASWADFGCSNGFIVEQMVAQNHGFRRIAGFDNTAELIEQARAKEIPNATFDVFDLNRISAPEERFDLVTCFETLEHVGHLHNAIANLVERVRDDGRLLISVPNETGWPGLVKFLGRAAVRRNPYDDFFVDGGRARYLGRLLLNRRIDGFRKPRNGYGPHLGFDYRSMEDHLRATYVAPGILTPRAREITTLGMNVLLVYQKSAA
jgi:SAM-dependent methyltransferase